MAVASMSRRLLIPVFTLGIFTSATLLFLVQPMFSKMALPLLGGSAAVWTTCMLCFQGLLLLGYFYAHVGPAWLGVRRHAALHLVLLLLSLLVLPIAIPTGWAPPAGRDPVPWLVTLLLVALGAPFALLSATGPLLQRWFASSDHPDAVHPYFLYAASNLGSLGALLAYPLLVEPASGLSAQSRSWAGGYLVLVALTIASAALARRAGGMPAAGSPEPRSSPEAPVPTWRERLHWVALALVPSSLFLGLTTYLTTEVAAVPLLWIIPLAVYLLAFTIAFSRRSAGVVRVAVRWQPLLLVPLVLSLFWGASLTTLLFIPLHLIAFFATALVCDGELARRAPLARRLTEFYLWIAVGGVLGGMFNVVVAPAIFTTGAEYPLMLIAAAALRPRGAAAPAGDLRIEVSLVIAVVLALGYSRLRFEAAGAQLAGPDHPWMAVAVLMITNITGILAYRASRWPLLFCATLGAVLIAGWGVMALSPRYLLTARSFYGMHRVMDDAEARLHYLVHGNTYHGAQSTDPLRQDEPLTYYSRGGPIGDLFRALPGSHGRRVGVVGLGAGTLAAYSAPGEHWSFFEIDPEVERIARDTRYFSYLGRSKADLRVVLGDGRLQLAAAPDRSLDVLVLDAFTSDAIPVHLLTREALTMYLDKLAPSGVLAVHLSNRFLNLEPVIGNLAAAAGLVARVRVGVVTAQQSHDGSKTSAWAVLARTSDALGSLAHDQRWREAQPDPALRVWTDDFSTLWPVVGRFGSQRGTSE